MNALNRFAIPFYCVMRLIAGLLLACHGGQMVLGWLAEPGQNGNHSAAYLVGGWIEIVGGFTSLLGLFTRLAAFICSGDGVAFFTMHAKAACFTHC